MIKKAVAIGAALAVIGAGGYYFLGGGGGGKQPLYKTEPAVVGDITEAVTASGTLNAITTVLVGTQVSGTVRHIYVDFNSPVKKGQVIAKIDPSAFEAQLDSARANLSAAAANVAKASASEADALRTLERTRELISRGLVARSELDAAQTAYDVAVAQSGAAAAAARQAEAAVKLAATNLAYTEIVSPVDGTVISRNVDTGQTVAASFQTPTLFVIAEDLTKMQIDANVNEADIGRVKAGQTAEFNVDAYPETAFKGKVVQVRSSPIVVQNVVTYDVVVRVDNPGLKLKPGMTANVSIITARKTGVLLAPNAALRFKIDDRNGRAAARRDKAPSAEGSGVWVLAEGRPARRKVAAGISDGVYTELASGEVKEGDLLITESLAKQQNPGQQRGMRLF